MAIDPNDFELVPDDEIDVDPQEVLDDALGEPTDTTADPETSVPQKAPFGKGWGFDFNANRFVTYGAGPAITHEHETLKTWIMKAINTARGAHVIYDEAFGLDDPWADIGYVDDENRQAAYESKIVDTLMEHDRIRMVTDFEFESEEDTGDRFATFTVITDNDDQIPIVLETEPVRA